MGFRNIMNNYYYGKQGKADFTLADLPKNRLELFGTVLKVRWAQLIGLNLVYLIAWIPAIIWTGMNVGVVYNVALEPDGQTTMASVIMVWLAVLAPCIAITGPFNAGVTYVLRNWARDQHSFMLGDFWDALKGNWKQGLIVSCISGIVPLIVFVAVYYYAGQLELSKIFILPIGLVMLAGLLWAMSVMLMYPMMVTYELKTRDVMRNALLLTVGRLPWALLMKLLTLVVPAIAAAVLSVVPDSVRIVSLVLMVLYLAFIPAFNKLITVSYANWLCETFINPKIAGAKTGIGLRPENWDDTEYRPEDDE